MTVDLRFWGRATACAVLLALGAGCGLIADKDRIKIAKVDDEYITRGDLFKVIREMPDDERPIIRNKGDMLRVLNAYIDGAIKTPLGEAAELETGKTLVSREAAMQRYFKEHEEDNYAAIYEIEDARAIGMSEAQLDVAKQQIDLGVDRVLDKLRGDAAVAYRAAAALKEGTLVLDDADFEQEYRVRKGELKKLEWMSFQALRFPTGMPGSETLAASVRKRVDAGEMFDAIRDEYAAKNPDLVVESEIENNPGLAKFRGFWVNASGCKQGDIIGPVYLPSYQAMAGVDEEGRRRVKNMPATYLVLKVLEHRPETTLELEQAKPALLPTILLAKMMEQLREEHGVEIYEDKLPDPSMFSRRRDRPGF